MVVHLPTFGSRMQVGKITVVANDGNDVEPVEVDRLIIAVSETYDIVVTIPSRKYGLRIFSNIPKTEPIQHLLYR
jgi:FtsP/CotA-like multicopper oxidase with cupredoxin domain